MIAPNALRLLNLGPTGWARTQSVYRAHRRIVPRQRPGRMIIPLPHPSGASTWPTKPGNAARIKRALKLIDRQRRMLRL